jgi:hypothetical protein
MSCECRVNNQGFHISLTCELLVKTVFQSSYFAAVTIVRRDYGFEKLTASTHPYNINDRMKAHKWQGFYNCLSERVT